jgi:ABC-type uncharacterized transport system substrate-binding protein
LAGKLATENRIPAIGFGRRFVESGGLLSFGPTEGESQIAAASIVYKIFQGAKPGDISVVQQRDAQMQQIPKWHPPEAAVGVLLWGRL